MLSKRIAHYCTEQMFFECDGGLQAEDGSLSESRYHPLGEEWGKNPEVSEKQTSFKSLYNGGQNSDRRVEALSSWYGLLWSYGRRKLSRPSDKLPAISGMAEIFAERLDDEYIAGLWRRHLVQGLLWQGLGCRRVSEYRAPTWSWASMDGIPGSGSALGARTIAEIEDVKIEKKGPSPFGEIKHGQIQIRAPLERLYWAIDGWDPTMPSIAYDKNPKVRTANGSAEGVYSRFDFASTASDAPQEALKIVRSLEGVDIFALVMLKIHRGKDEIEPPNPKDYQALIVRRVQGGKEMQRLGFIFLGEEDFGEKPETLARRDLPVITLV